MALGVVDKSFLFFLIGFIFIFFYNSFSFVKVYYKL